MRRHLDCYERVAQGNEINNIFNKYIMLKHFIIVFSSLSFLSGCQSMSTGGSISTSSSALAQDSLYPNSPAIEKPFPWSGGKTPASTMKATDDHSDLWRRIGSQLTWQDIDNPRVDQAREAFLAQYNYLPLLSERGSLYLYYIVEQVEKRGLPMELVLVPIVESTLDPFAYSSGSAAGLWQIMPTTGQHLGLQQDWWFDGRRAIRDSTRVALDYLEELNAQFDNDWMLTLAAYNAGRGRVSRAQRKNIENGRPTDYWSLDLPRETQRYVPRILAMTQILAEPSDHDADIPPVPNEPAFEVARTGGQIELAQAAELADLSVETLKELNPGHLRWATAPDREHEILVPVGYGAVLEGEIAELPPEQRVRWRYYRIESGDNLISIAKKFNTDVALLRQANGIKGSMIRAGSTLMIPASDYTSGLAIAGDAPAASIGYKVRRGDSLARIAGKYKVTVDDIVAWNALDPRKYLQPGQTLKLHLGGF